MRHPISILSGRMRLVSESPLLTQERDQTGVSHNKVTRPLVLCPILFEQRYGQAEPWQVAVTANGLLQPRAPLKAARLEQVVKRHRAAGVRCRLGLALITPDDFRRRLRHSNASFTHEQSPSHLPRSDNWQPRLRSDIYGWSLVQKILKSSRILLRLEISFCPTPYSVVHVHSTLFYKNASGFDCVTRLQALLATPTSVLPQSRVSQKRPSSRYESATPPLDRRSP